MADILENAEADLTPQMRSLINMLWDVRKLVEEQIKKLDLELERISAADAGCTRIRQIPGIGPVVATAIVATIGNGAGSIWAGTSLRGWVSCHASTQLEVKRSCSASASAATSTCVRF